jgi:flavodoxin
MFAEAIAEALNVPVISDINTVEASDVAEYDFLILGTPVHAFNPSRESVAFVKTLLEVKGKQAILFCTYRLWKGRVFGKLKKELKKKGYNTILCVSSKAKEFKKEDFKEQVSKIVKKLEE